MSLKIISGSFISLFLIFSSLISCSQKDSDEKSPITWQTVQDTTDRVAIIKGGLSGPEAVQYDPDQDLYFISNFNGGGTEADSNGFISRSNIDGEIDSLKFITGTKNHPLHAPRGMYIIGDTLFVADQYGIHGFNRYSGKQIHFTDFTTLDPGFLNDLSMGPDSALYITDSRKPRIYRMSGSEISIAVDSLPHPNNGIILDKSNSRLIIGPWNDSQTFLTWNPLTSYQGEAGQGVGGKYDGIEMLGDSSFIVTSHMDSTLQIINQGEGKIIVKTTGLPADIGLDTKRMRVLVPYIVFNRVDIWQLPTRTE